MDVEDLGKSPNSSDLKFKPSFCSYSCSFLRALAS